MFPNQLSIVTAIYLEPGDGSDLAWYNLVRTNSNKDKLSPWQIIRKLSPNTTIDLAKLAPLMLDWLGQDHLTKEQLAIRGDDVPFLP